MRREGRLQRGALLSGEGRARYDTRSARTAQGLPQRAIAHWRLRVSARRVWFSSMSRLLACRSPELPRGRRFRCVQSGMARTRASGVAPRLVTVVSDPLAVGVRSGVARQTRRARVPLPVRLCTTGASSPAMRTVPTHKLFGLGANRLACARVIPGGRAMCRGSSSSASVRCPHVSLCRDVACDTACRCAGSWTAAAVGEARGGAGRKLVLSRNPQNTRRLAAPTAP